MHSTCNDIAIVTRQPGTQRRIIIRHRRQRSSARVIGFGYIVVALGVPTALRRGRDNATLYNFDLPHNRQREVIAVAASVARLEGVAVAGEGRAVGKIAERARDRRRGGVVYHPENCARGQSGATKIAKGKLRAAIDSHTEGELHPPWRCCSLTVLRRSHRS